MTCAWSDLDTQQVPLSISDVQIARLVELVGLPQWLTRDEPEYRLARESFRHGVEAALASHDCWVERER